MCLRRNKLRKIRDKDDAIRRILVFQTDSLFSKNPSNYDHKPENALSDIIVVVSVEEVAF